MMESIEHFFMRDSTEQILGSLRKTREDQIKRNFYKGGQVALEEFIKSVREFSTQDMTRDDILKIAESVAQGLKARADSLSDI